MYLNSISRVLISMSELLWFADIPFIAARSYGLIGSTRLQLKEHTIIESHPDTQNPDLRLTPFFNKMFSNGYPGMGNSREALYQ